ncbi:toll/interleukin-1 receptor domain-containing protein [Streptomyces avicenniae]|uniref:toll/interleukin-1 receptor domain-containing protein n=1 Tax=Streptomyces avicenniae TaxID=500153 RepID=UPI00069A5820|nr:toll/interleukin-1 receptor domain-containing protein [Streptomyces avicenniae]
MPAVFINYRTTDGKEVANTFYDELSRRFGDGAAFLAAKSIPPGSNYIDAIHEGVRRCSVLLALIGPGWLDTPHKEQPGMRALDAEKDWVRREIEEAFAHGVTVIPILIGRSAGQLDRRALPASIAGLAECQYMRWTLRTTRHDLAHIGDRLAQQVPELAAADQGALPQQAEGAARPEALPDRHIRDEVRTTGQSGGIGNVSGVHGTVIGEANAPLHTGSGTQVNGTQVNGTQVNGTQVHGTQMNGTEVNGDGNVVGGSDFGGLQQQFGPSRRRREQDR